MIITGAEWRLVLTVRRYTANITPICALALAATVPRLQAPVLRDFLERYVASRVFFGVSIVSCFPP